jgi:hypothetical protein
VNEHSRAQQIGVDPANIVILAKARRAIRTRVEGAAVALPYDRHLPTGRLKREPAASSYKLLTATRVPRQTNMANDEMFSPLRPRRNRFGIALSLAAHIIVIYFMVRVPAAFFIQPAPAALGAAGRSAQKVDLLEMPAPVISLPVKTITLVARQPKLQLPRDAQSKHHKLRTVVESQQTPPVTPSDNAGSEYGTLADGMEHDIRPALPVVFPDPPIFKRDLPDDVKGDVIIEITIDAHGYVVATRILAALGHGIEERVISTLEHWRFRPATRDGIPIASKQDVHFHLPS